MQLIMINLFLEVLNKPIMLILFKKTELINVMLLEMFISLKKCLFTLLISLFLELMPTKENH